MHTTDKRIRGRKLQAIRASHFAMHPLCVHCEQEGKVRLAQHLDHILALYNGGEDVPSNRQGLCIPCHDIKTMQDMGFKPRQFIGLDGYPVQVPYRPLSREAQERRFPSDLRRSRIPVSMVCGPPASGKSTYLRAHVGPDDVVIDLDAIMQGLSGLPEHHTGSEWLARALDERNRQLKTLATDTMHKHAWFVISAPDQTERSKWATTLGAQVVLLDTTLDECIRRINTDPARQGHTQRMIDAATSWWAQNRRAPRVVAGGVFKSFNFA